MRCEARINAYPVVDRRKMDPFMDRRSGEDRRAVYSLEYFADNNVDRRNSIERRSKHERRGGYIRVSEWSSACPGEKC